jgi:hypothetical protein
VLPVSRESTPIEEVLRKGQISQTVGERVISDGQGAINGWLAQRASQGFAQGRDVPAHRLDPLKASVLMSSVGQSGHGFGIGVGQRALKSRLVHEGNHAIGCCATHWNPVRFCTRELIPETLPQVHSSSTCNRALASTPAAVSFI